MFIVKIFPTLIDIHFNFSLFNEILNYWTGEGVSPEYWQQVHFIGHSLGAHIVGQAAELLKTDDNFEIYRVTGLDPANPCFEDPRSPLRLSI